MPIEFRCIDCNKLLRTKDEAAGKPAKCPECGTRLTVPATSTATADLEEPAGHSYGGYSKEDFGVENPYSSPRASSADEPVPGDWGPTHAEFTDVLGRTWQIYTDNLGMCVAGFAVFFAAMFGTNIAGVIVQVVLQVGIPKVGIILSLVFSLMLNVFRAYLHTGIQLFMLKVARGESYSIADLFGGGRWLVSIVLAWILLGVVFAMIVAAIAFGLFASGIKPQQGFGPFEIVMISLILPVIFAGLILWPFPFVVIDRNVGPIDGLKYGVQIGITNLLTTFLLFLVCGLASILLVIFTCGIGIFFVGPFLVLLLAVMYLCMTGQRTGDQKAP